MSENKNKNKNKNKKEESESESESELIFKITTRVKSSAKTPEMIYLSASNNLVRWASYKKELIRLTCNDKELNDGIIFAEHGFWTESSKLDKLIEKGKIKIEMQ